MNEKQRMTDDHLGLAGLMALTDPGIDEKDWEKARGHLTSCERCRSMFISMNTFRSALFNLPDNTEPFELTEECVPTELMGDFLGDRLLPSERLAYSRHIAECDMCFERASYFTHVGLRMAEGVLKMERTPFHYLRAAAPGMKETTPSVTAVAPARKGTLRRWLASPVPAYAFAASLLFFMLIWSPQRRAGDIIDLRSSPFFTLYEAPAHPGPSFGFSDAGRKIGETSADLRVERTADGRLLFHWNAVDGASEYRFSLQELRPSAPVEIYDTKTGESRVYLDASIVESGKAYRWNVSGAIGPDTIFSATGQFAYTE